MSLASVFNGNKILFFKNEYGDIVMRNSGAMALKLAQDAFAGEAARVDLETEDDVVNLVKSVRSEMWEERHACNG